jgi:hypothetical protein
MMVLDYICKICNYKCNAFHFQQNFEKWTSGNNDIDKFIQDTQLSGHTWHSFDSGSAFEWIPYCKFNNIKYIAEGKVYKANWIDGKISYWDNNKQNWERNNQNMIVILKSINNSKNITIEFKDEV